MGDTATLQLRRILALIPRVADDETHPLDIIAASLGTTPRQLISDFQSITERFDVAGFVECVRIYVSADTVSMTASEFHRPMRLTMPELCALELGLVMLRLERTPAEQHAIDRAIARLREAISKLPANDAHEGLREASLLNATNAQHLGTTAFGRSRPSGGAHHLPGRWRHGKPHPRAASARRGTRRADVVRGDRGE